MGPDAGAKAEDSKGSIELIDPKVLRVCADPNNLPFSNEAGQGFENKLAELLAAKLGKRLAYAYYPGATGFVRNTLNAHLCDVIIGIPQGDDLVQPTNPYYRTTYAVAFRAASGLDGLKTLDDPRLKDNHRRIGLVANTPPGNVLAANGLLAAVKSYPLMVDTRFESSSAAMIGDLEKGDIDVAILWGPIAGYYAKNAGGRLSVAPLLEESGARLSFRIGMGVRHSDQQWKRELNRLIAQNQAEINTLLIAFGVPLLDEAGRALAVAPDQPPPEPAGYRMSDYHAKVPATLKGAKVLTTQEAFELWGEQRSVFIDALGRPPKPAGLPEGTVWRETPRQDIPGSIWLADTGYGELPPPTLRYFEAGLERAAGKDKTKPLVFYCRTDCWASWNAAKRALTLGYANVSWYPEGADGWASAGHPLEERQPEPRE
ncbi:MAG: quinoprotein dehydrogenase-associated putative ABC transporter substrate-binding protein [Methylocystis sp.]|nr:quinoprotein dehydrogenase-associated putative ABC transporter substrate-binding protein [Methylocystis sp.]